MSVLKKYEKRREENKNKKVVIVGTAESVFEIDYNMPDTEYWALGAAFGKAHNDIKKVDLGFEIHPIDQIMVIAQERQVDFNKFNCPVLVQKKDHPITKQLINNPVNYPLDDILKYIEELNASVYMTSSFCYMLVYAAMLGYKEVHIMKVLLTSDLEFYMERPGLEYWIDMLGHKEHMTFIFPEDAEFWKERILYGYEQRPNMWKLESRKKHLWSCLMQHFHQVENLTGFLARNSGILEGIHIMKNIKEDEKINKIINECRSGINKNSGKLKESRDMYMQFLGGLQDTIHIEERQY